MSSNRSLIVAMVAVVVAGCSTNTVRLDYTAGNIEAAKYTDVRPIDTVIVFDHRSNDSHWLGAIRGGFGNALKTLATEEAVSEVVQDAFEGALQARGIPSEGTGPFTMRIHLIRFDCSQYVRREAHAKVTVMLEGSDGETQWTESFQSDVIQGSVFALDAGIFGDVEDLRKVALQALNEVTNQAFNDPGFIDTLRQPTSAAAGAASAPAVAVTKPKQESKQYITTDGKAVAETLAALKVLHGQGVLSDEEYMQKQRGVINEHTRKLQASLRGDVPLTTAEASLPQKVSPSGATAAATVTVAAVKDESESELSKSTRGTRSIGLLPMKLLSSSHLAHMALEFEAGRELQTLLAKAVDIKVEYSAYYGNSTASLHTETLWEAQLFHPNVREEQLRRLGERLGVDYVVTAWLGTGRASGSEGITPWPLDLFVLRVRDGELRVFKTNNKSLGPTVQKLTAFVREL